MSESPDALRQTIADTQDDLSRNLEALESKGQDLIDWRAHFEKRPLALLGAAFVGGVLAANMVSGGRSSRERSSDSFSDSTSKQSKTRRESNDSWNRLRSGIGVAAAGIAMEAISKALPGIKENVIEPIRAAMRPDEQLPLPDRRFGGVSSKPQGNGYSG